jgi:alginate O-acetyltransferase complex protein AlgI
MSFASLLFLWVFLPVVLALYWIFPAAWRNIILSAASVVFYSYGAHDFVVILLLMIAFNYLAALFVGGTQHPARVRNRGLALAIAVNLGVLCYWKYGGFLDQQVVDLSRLFGGHYHRTIETTLPLGISFFTFHNISYLVDIRRETKPPIRKPITFATYILMFPQLVAGPIVRYHEIADQLIDVRTDRWADLAAGFPRFAHGLFKKVVIADSVAPISDAAFGIHSGLTTPAAWIGTLAYTLQIYFDFSGYSDMAIGMGRMFGFQLPENFARPYSAESMTDFWRRWHMSLSRWFRDYLYIPLGGNRQGSARTYLNLVVVFALTGLWHGAAWTFLFWGLYHGSLLILERRNRDRPRNPARAGLFRLRTLLLVMVGWVLFRSTGLTPALKMLAAMAVPRHLSMNSAVTVAMTRERTVILILATLVVLLPRDFVVGPLLQSGRGIAAGWARLGVSTVGALVAAMFVASGTFHPFLYYQF